MNTSSTTRQPFGRSCARSLACVLLLWALPAEARQAQDTPSTGQTGDRRPWYLGVTVVAATRPAGERDYHYTSPMLGGTAPEVIATAGVHLMPHVSVGGEVSFGKAVSRVLVFNHFLYFSDLVAYRETIASGFVRFHATAGRVTIEPLLAIGLAFGRTSFTQHWDYRDNMAGPDQFYNAIHLAWGPGVDVAVRCSPRISVVGSARLYGVRRTPISEVGGTGMTNRTYQVGAGLRFTFQ